MKFKIAPFYLLVLPDLDDQKIGEVQIFENAREQFTGTIVEIGAAPWPYRNLKPGDRILYARSQAATITATVDGKQRDLRAVSLGDYRAKILNDEVQASNSAFRRGLQWTRVRVAAFALTTAFIGGFALGHLRGSQALQSLRDLVVRRITSSFRPKSGSKVGASGTRKDESK